MIRRPTGMSTEGSTRASWRLAGIRYFREIKDMITWLRNALIVCFLPFFASAQDRGPLLDSSFIYATAPFPECHAATIAEAANGLVTAFFGEGRSSINKRRVEKGT